MRFVDVLAVDAEADPYALEFVDAAEGHDAKVPEYDDYSCSAWHGNYTWTDKATPRCGSTFCLFFFFNLPIVTYPNSQLCVQNRTPQTDAFFRPFGFLQIL